MKKLFAFLMVCTFALAFAACDGGAKESTEESSDDATETAAPETDTTAAPMDTTAADSTATM